MIITNLAHKTGPPFRPMAVAALDDLSLPFSMDSSKVFRIVRVKEGQATYRLDLHRGILCAGQVLCARPGQVLLFDDLQKANGYFLEIATGFLDGLEHMLVLSASPEGIPIRPGDAQDLDDVSEKIAREISAPALREDILRHYAEIFLIHLTRSVKELFKVATKTRNVELTEDFIELLEKHFREKKMVSEYARMLSVTANYLNEIVKKVTGQSAGNHIRQRIALEAKRHAVHSSMCMKEVAYSLGFADMAHFSKFFKNATGKNFTEFKKERISFQQSVPFAAAAN